MRAGLFIVLTLFLIRLNAQDSTLTFLAKQKLFPTRIFDPLEKLSYFTFSKLIQYNNLNYEYISPFAFGFHKSLVSWKEQEVVLKAAMHSQFLWRYENNQWLHGMRKSYMNTDFIAEIGYTYTVSKHLFLNLSWMHRSTHFGDDYILVNGTQDSGYWENDPTNYEILNLAGHFKKSIINIYGRVGYITRAETVRKKLELQSGFYITDIGKSKYMKKLIVGADFRMLENNEYYTNIKTGVGYKFTNDIYFLIEYYNGYIPYSRLEVNTKVAWFGAGFYFDPVF